MYPKIAVADADAQADLALLEAIADWCDRYTPLVGLDPPDGLMLDITGCAHLFGGEAALARRSGRGGSTRRASGARRGRRYGRLRVGGGALCRKPADRAVRRRRETLSPPPARGSAPRADTIAALAQVGLKRIADVLDRPRAPLAARFGADFVRRLDQALGREDEPITPRLPIPPRSPSSAFAEPIALEARRARHHRAARRRAWPRCWSGAAKARGCCRPRCFAPTARCFRIEVGTGEPLRDAGAHPPSVRRPARRDRRRMRSGLRLRHAAALRARRPSAASRRRPGSRRPTTRWSLRI